MALGATPVLAGLIRPLPLLEINPVGLRLSATRLIRWRDIETAHLRTTGVNRLVITLKPSPRDPGGPPQRALVWLPAVIEPRVRQAAAAMIARNLAGSEPARIGQTVDKPKARGRQRPVQRIEDKRLQEVAG
jgi:hypothetical protein